MNRQQRRALARIHGRHAAAEQRKQSHRLEPQICALWSQEAQMYVAEFEPGRIRFVDCAELAQHFDEDEATRSALILRDLAGLRVEVRRVHPQPLTFALLTQ